MPMVLLMFLSELWLAYLIIGYLIFNGFLQLYFVSWVLGRNKKLTLLLVEHHRKVQMDDRITEEYE